MPKIHYDVRDIRAICELTRAADFKEAADALSITSSALSRRVAKLESAIGGLLVMRTTRSMALTPLGKRVAARCEPLVASLDECMQECARIAKGMEGQIAIGCVSSIAFTVLPPLLGEFRQRHPHLRINLKDDDGARITTAVLDHEVDFGLTTVGTRNPDLVSEHVAADPFVLVCSPEHELANNRKLQWRQIATCNLIGFKASSSLRQILDKRLQRDGLELMWFDEVDSLSALISHLNTGAFVGVVPKLIAGHLQLATVTMTAPRIQRNIYLVRRRDASLNAPAQWLWSTIRRQLSGG